MAAVKSKSEIYCSSKLDDGTQRMNISNMSFGIFDIVFVLFSMVTFVADLSTDLFLVVDYFTHGHMYWAVSTFLLIVLPATVVQMFSMRWHIMDDTVSCYHWLAHVFLLGLMHRYVLVLKTGLEARVSGDPTDFQRLYHQQNDICMLHLFESFMESAPQLVLQLYIMATLEAWQSWTGISAVASLASLAWAVAAYTRAMRRARPDKMHVSWPGLLCQAMWRGGMVTARIATLVLFAVGFHSWLLLLMGLHWLGMTIWIVFQRTDFCPTPWEECIYNCVVGVIYCFSFFNLQEGQSRHRALTFYIIIVTQNIGCLCLFLTLTGVSKTGLVEVAAAMIIGGTVLGLISMLLYYRFFHPAGPIRLCAIPLQHNVECGTTEQTATMRSLKHCTVNRVPGSSSQEESPHSDDICMDKKLLLTHCVISPHENEETSFEAANKQKRRGICSPLELGLEETTEENKQKHQGMKSLDLESNMEERINEEKQKRRGICSLDPDLGLEDEKQKRRAICSLDSGLNLNERVEDEKQKRRGICSLDPGLELDKQEQIHHGIVKSKLEDRTEVDKQKRRGICSLDPGLELVEDEQVHHGNCVITQAVEERTEVDKQKRRGICSLEPGMEVELELGISLDLHEEKVDNSSDSVVEGKQVEEEAPSEVLSVPSEVLSAHDYENMCAVNIAREAWGLRSWRAYSDIETWLHDDSVVRDRRRDTLTSTTSASSEHSGGMSSPPPIPCRRPTRTPRTRQDDYLDTLVDDLACCEFVLEEPDPNVFVARPYVVDQHGALFPLGTLDTIMEELEESSSSTEPKHGSASTLVATIDEIRHGNLWEVQNDPPQCQVPLTPEEVLFLSKLQPTSESSPELILDAAPYLETVPGSPLTRKRPRRKFSLLREKFESKQAVTSSSETTRPTIDNSRMNIEERIKQWNNILNSYNSGQDSHIVKSVVKDRRNLCLKQVLSPSWTKKEPHTPSAKVVPAT